MVADYAGTLLLVSHDRAFLDSVVTSTLVFEGAGRVNEYVGGYTDWLRQRKDSPDSGNVPAAKAAAKDAAEPAAAASAPSLPSIKARRLSYGERRELKLLPEKIQLLEAEQSALQTAVSDPELFRRDKDQGAASLQRLQALAAELETAYARWDALES
jgi:ABC transport system ATP-binding/permease protein